MRGSTSPRRRGRRGWDSTPRFDLGCAQFVLFPFRPLLSSNMQRGLLKWASLLGTIPSPSSSPSHPSALPLPLPPHNHSNNLLRLRGASTSAGCAASCKASPRIAPFGMTWSQCSGTTVSTSEPCQSFDLQGLAEETWRNCPAVPSLPPLTFKVGLLATQKTIYLPTQ